MASFNFRCSECASAYAEHEARLTCPACSQQQRPGGETRGVLEVVLDGMPTAWPSGPLDGSRFLEAFLPIASADSLPPLAVGNTPLVAPRRLRQALAMPRLWLKDDTRNPSGSTKDRASQLVVAKAVEYGIDTIATASTGNAASALAAVAAAADRRAVVFVPASAPTAKLAQMLAYGAEVVRVDGSYDDAFEMCLAVCSERGFYNRNTALNPFTIEGKKTAALEIAAQLAPEEADVVVVPTGDGVIIAGIAKGFADLLDGGIIERLPRLLAVQPEGSAAIATALLTGASSVERVKGAASVADSLVVDAPRNGRLAVDRVRRSGGGGAIVSDEAIVRAIPRLAGSSGVFAEPAAAAALAGLDSALADGSVERHERVVLLITGSGLKDVPAVTRSVAVPDPVPPELEAVLAEIG